jgi:hypothetical protein
MQIPAAFVIRVGATDGLLKNINSVYVLIHKECTTLATQHSQHAPEQSVHRMVNTI